MSMSPPLHVEVVQKRQSRASKEYIKEIVHQHLSSLHSLRPGAVLGADELEECAELHEHVQCVTLCDAGHAPDSELAAAGARLVFHVHTLDARGAERDALPGGEGEEAAACEAWALPSEEFHGLWESLVFESGLKEETLRFVETSLEWGARGVDPRQVAWNRVVLLHGPPGTGKTSLCRALAHKLAVRLADTFPRARLLEINAHGLFSKWFSESGKLVTALFDRIHEIVDDPRLLVFVLIDEVESLTHARRAALAGLEPSDSIRAVNAVLGALDRLKRRRNALVLATSNVTGAIDAAFLDRADLVRRVGPPPARAAYAVLRGAALELARCGLLAREPLFPLAVLDAARHRPSAGACASLRLLAAARAAAARRLSARALRRLPLLAAALHAPSTSCTSPTPAPLSMLQFAEALHAALDRYVSEAQELDADSAAPAPPAPPLCNGN